MSGGGPSNGATLSPIANTYVYPTPSRRDPLPHPQSPSGRTRTPGPPGTQPEPPGTQPGPPREPAPRDLQEPHRDHQENPHPRTTQTQPPGPPLTPPKEPHQENPNTGTTRTPSTGTTKTPAGTTGRTRTPNPRGARPARLPYLYEHHRVDVMPSTDKAPTCTPTLPHIPTSEPSRLVQQPSAAQSPRPDTASNAYKGRSPTVRPITIATLYVTHTFSETEMSHVRMVTSLRSVRQGQAPLQTGGPGTLRL